jgi:hypothetical protein
MEDSQDSRRYVLDSEDVRRNAAWFAAGAGAFASYSFVACIVTVPVVGFGSALLGADAAGIVSSITVGMLMVHALILQCLGFKARRVARTESVKVDPF